MLRKPFPPRRRPAAALVETAAVIGVFLLLLFGILEYCRLVYVRQLTANAAREGARYAVVNTQSATLEADTRARVIAYMGGQDGQLRNFVVQVYHGDANGDKVYAHDPTGAASVAYFSNATGKYLETSNKSKLTISQDAGGDYVLNGSTKHYITLNSATGTVTPQNPASFNALVANKQIKGLSPPTSAQFGQYIVVQIDCDYDPILPSFLYMNQTFRFTAKSLMYSEAN